MGKPLRVLVVEDSQDDTLLLIHELQRGGFDPVFEYVATEETMMAAITNQTWDIIISDYVLPHFSGLEALRLLQKSGRDLPFIIVSGKISEEIAVEAMKAGAHDYMSKNNLKRFVPAVERELSEAKIRRERKKADEQLRAASLYARNLIEASLDPLVTISSDGKISDVNKAAEEVTGVSRERLVGSDFADYFTEPEKARAGYEQVFSQGVVKDYPLTIRHTSGRLTDVLYNASVYKNEAGEVQGVFAAARDITERKQVEEALRTSEVRYRRLFETAKDGILILDAETGMIVDVNPFLVEMLGFPHERFVGKALWEIGLFRDIASNKNKFSELQRQGYVRYEDLPLETANGQRIEVEFVSNIYTVDHQKVIQCNIRDITERKRAEEEIKQGNERFQLVCRGTHDAVWDWNLQTNDLWWNENFQTLFGYRAEEIEPGIESWTNRIHPEDLDRVVTGIHEVIDAGKVFWSDQYRFRRKDGSYSEIYDRGYVMRDACGNPVRMIGAMQDITERKRAEDALRASEIQYRRLFEAAKDGILILDAETGTIVDVNPFLVEMLGFSYEQFMGKAIWEVGLFRDIASNKDKFIELQRQKYVRYEDLPLEMANGKQIDVEFVSNVYTVDHKKVIQCNIRDITDRKQLERELKSNIEMKSKFTSMVSHELRSPLGAIKEGINLVLEGLAGSINDEQRDLLDTAKRNTDRLGRLINNVLDFQKMESGKIGFDIRENDINEAVLEVNEAMSFLAKEKSLDLAADADNNIPKVRFDKDKIIQVLTNLVGNAIKYTEKGNITISTKQEDNTVHVIVQDTGTGIKTEDMEKLFQAFEQLDSGIGKKKGGTGLGLAISKEIILAHKGKIWAESEVGKGSNFHFILPLKERRLV